jgi:hypothetical protein
MERIPDTVDVAVIAERLRPLAQQASESLRHTSEGLRHTSEDLWQSLDHAREAVADRLAPDAPVTPVRRPAAFTLAARGLPVAARLRDLRRSPLEWLALAVATAVVATLAAIAIAALARRMQARRERSTIAGAGVEAVQPVVIPISEEVADDATGAETARDDVEERIAEAG